MKQYRITFVEKVFYEIYVEADNTEEAVKKYIKHSDVLELLHPSEWLVRG